MGTASHTGIFAAPKQDESGRVHLVGQDLQDIERIVTERGFQKFRAKQIYHWIYQHGATNFEQMHNISKDLQLALAEHFTLDRPFISVEQKSNDGTRKWLMRMVDKQEIETVFIPEDDRGALCVSSQVGCTLTCRFCHTGTQPLVRNLGAGEIICQAMHARDALGEWPSSSTEPRLFTNIVMMGMGEPLYNYDNVAKALRLLMDGNGFAISRRRITLSTSGVVPMIRRCGEELGVNLAISLHAVTNELRDQIIPLNKKYPLEELLQACRDYPPASNARRITIEYVMLKDVNDSDIDARELVRLLRGIPAKVNLIPFNPWPNAPFECSSNNRIQAFANILTEAGYQSPIRRPRGRDILAACGQLRSESQRQKRVVTLEDEKKAG